MRVASAGLWSDVAGTAAAGALDACNAFSSGWSPRGSPAVSIWISSVVRNAHSPRCTIVPDALHFLVQRWICTACAVPVSPAKAAKSPGHAPCLSVMSAVNPIPFAGLPLKSRMLVMITSAFWSSGRYAEI